MKKTKTLRAIILSGLSVLLCISMLAGTTFAWFTDSAESGRNQIVAGNLDVELYHSSGKTAEALVDKTTVLFSDVDSQLWEPGAMAYEKFKVVNKGSLALQYQFALTVLDATVIDNVSFASMLKVAVVTDESFVYSRENIAQLTSWTGLDTFTFGGELIANEEADVFGIVIWWEPSDIDNKFNMNNGQTAGSVKVDVGVTLSATQYSYESDGFDESYDKEAGESATASGTAVSGQELVLNAGVAPAANTKMTTVAAPAGSFDEGDVVAVNVTTEGTLMQVKAEGGVIGTLDVTMTVNGVQTSGDLADGAYTVSTYIAKGLSNVTVTYTGDDGKAQPTDVTYDANSGKLSFKTTHFSEYAVSASACAYDVENDKSYSSVDDIVAAINDKDTVVLVSDWSTAFSVEDVTMIVQAYFDAAEDGDTITMPAGLNTNATPLTSTINVTKNVTVLPNGMYLVSSAPATFTVAEGASLTVGDGSFTIKNTATNGAAVYVDGGSFTMQGGSFDAHTAVKTAEGKSSTVAMTAGWSNRVTVAFHSQGNDTINVSGGSIYSSAESVKTTAGTHLTFNMSGGLLSSRTTQYSAAVNLQCTATVNMTGGKIENTYSSGYNGSSAIQVNVAPTTVNLSGTAALSSNGVAVMLGSHWDPPAVHEEKITFNMSGDSSISATSVMGFGIRYAQDNCDVTIAGNAKVNATYQAIQFNTNNYVYTNSTLTVAENATITSTAGRIGGGYGIAANGYVTITGGTITGSTAGVASFQEGAVIIVDNSESGTPITINKTDIAEVVDYTVAGNPTIG